MRTEKINHPTLYNTNYVALNYETHRVNVISYVPVEAHELEDNLDHVVVLPQSINIVRIQIR